MVYGIVYEPFLWVSVIVIGLNATCPHKECLVQRWRETEHLQCAHRSSLIEKILFVGLISCWRRNLKFPSQIHGHFWPQQSRSCWQTHGYTWQFNFRRWDDIRDYCSWILKEHVAHME